MDVKTRANNSLLIELVGPAGAGKTTLSNALNAGENSAACSFPDFRDPKEIPFFISNTAVLLPVIWKTKINGGARGISRREMVEMAILNGWFDKLKREMKKGHPLLVLDQGPVYILAGLSHFGNLILEQPSLNQWREKMIRQWANNLSAIILIDAPNSVLLQRIDSREKWHRVKNLPAAEQAFFLDDCRAAFISVVEILKRYNQRLKVLEYDTAFQQPQDIAGQIIQELGSSPTQQKRPSGMTSINQTES